MRKKNEWERREKGRRERWLIMRRKMELSKGMGWEW